MRATLGIVSLLVVLAVVGLLTRKSLDTTKLAVPAANGAAAVAPTGTVREQSQQIQQQYRQALEKALNQPRPEPVD